MKKGQMVFEFIIAAVLFLAVVVYTFNYMSSAVSTFSSGAFTNSLHVKGMQASELILRSKGSWSGGVPDALGVAEEWPMLSPQYLQNLEDYCEDNYDDGGGLLEKLGFSGPRKTFIKIIVKDHEGGIVCQCAPDSDMPEGSIVAHVRRFAVSEQMLPLSIDVWTWY